MTNLELRKNELHAELMVCKLAIKMQKKVNEIEKLSKESNDMDALLQTQLADGEKITHEEYRQRVTELNGNLEKEQRALFKLLKNAGKTFTVKLPVRCTMPMLWKTWVRSWNTFCYTHDKDRYALYVRNL